VIEFADGNFHAPALDREANGRAQRLVSGDVQTFSRAQDGVVGARAWRCARHNHREDCHQRSAFHDGTQRVRFDRVRHAAFVV
jgi:hypothetical protein